MVTSWSFYTVNGLFTWGSTAQTILSSLVRWVKKKIMVYSIHFIVNRYLKTRITYSGEYRTGKIPRSRPWYDTIEKYLKKISALLNTGAALDRRKSVFEAATIVKWIDIKLKKRIWYLLSVVDMIFEFVWFLELPTCLLLLLFFFIFASIPHRWGQLLLFFPPPLPIEILLRQEKYDIIHLCSKYFFTAKICVYTKIFKRILK